MEFKSLWGIAAAFIVQKLEVLGYNYKQAYLCILPPPTCPPSLTSLLLSQGGQRHGRWSRGTATHLASPNRGKGTGRALGHLTKNTMLLWYSKKYTHTHAHTPCYRIFAWTISTQMAKSGWILLQFWPETSHHENDSDGRKTIMGKNTLKLFVLFLKKL